MDIANIYHQLTDQGIYNFLFKLFSIFFSGFYIFYSIIVLSQVRVMSRTVKTRTTPLLITVSLVQVLIGVLLLILAFTLL